jgi:hypothetical protein
MTTHTCADPLRCTICSPVTGATFGRSLTRDERREIDAKFWEGAESMLFVPTASAALIASVAREVAAQLDRDAASGDMGHALDETAALARKLADLCESLATPERPERPAVALDPVSAANGVVVHPSAVSSCPAPAPASTSQPSTCEISTVENSPRVEPGGEPETDDTSIPAASLAKAYQGIVADLRATVTALDSRLATAEQRATVAEQDSRNMEHVLTVAKGFIADAEKARQSAEKALAVAEASRARAEQEATTLRTALDFYAASAHYTLHVREMAHGRRQVESPLVVQDGGATARAALRPDETPETPRPASTADLDQRDRALGR